ncbi:unnamed protein product [Ixodes hexagonus]
MLRVLAFKQLARAPSALRALPASQARCASTPAAATTKDGREVLHVPGESPERDLVNFPRLKRPLLPGKVRMGIFPEEWFEFFYRKTGVTGPYLFGTGLVGYLYSKELLIMDHEFYSGLTLLFMAWYGVKKFGPGLSEYLDREVDREESDLDSFRQGNVDHLQASIEAETLAQWQAQGQHMLFDAKRENVLLQLEAEFRRRQMAVYGEVKRRLDYHLEVQNIQRRLQQRHMVDWIVSSVVKSITPQQEQDTLRKCIVDLKGLAATA